MNSRGGSYIDLARRTGRYSDGKVKAYKELMAQSMTGIYIFLKMFLLGSCDIINIVKF